MHRVALPHAPTSEPSALMMRMRHMASSHACRTRTDPQCCDVQNMRRCWQQHIPDLHDDELVAADARFAVGQGGGTLGLRRRRHLGKVRLVRHARTAGLPTQRGGGCEARTEGSFRASSTMKSLPSPYIFLKGTLLHGIGPPVSRKSMRAAVQSANLSRVPHGALCEVRTCPYLFLF